MKKHDLAAIALLFTALLLAFIWAIGRIAHSDTTRPPAYQSAPDTVFCRNAKLDSALHHQAQIKQKSQKTQLQ